MPFPKPGNPETDEGLTSYQVLAAVMNLGRRVLVDGQFVTETEAYQRGDVVQLNADYADPYLRTGLLREVQDRPKRLTGAAAKAAAAKAAREEQSDGDPDAEG